MTAKKSKIERSFDPSRPLRNTRHEKFCQARVSGLDVMKSYIHAGYSRRGARQHGHRLVTKGDIQARIHWYQEQSTNAKVASVLRRKELLTEGIEGALNAYLSSGADGAYVDYGPESPYPHAVREISMITHRDEHGGGETLTQKLKLVDYVKAIAELNKMEGVYPAEKHQLDVGSTLAEALAEIDGTPTPRPRQPGGKKRKK